MEAAAITKEQTTRRVDSPPRSACPLLEKELKECNKLRTIPERQESASPSTRRMKPCSSKREVYASRPSRGFKETGAS